MRARDEKTDRELEELAAEIRRRRAALARRLQQEPSHSAGGSSSSAHLDPSVLQSILSNPLSRDQLTASSSDLAHPSFSASSFLHAAQLDNSSSTPQHAAAGLLDRDSSSLSAGSHPASGYEHWFAQRRDWLTNAVVGQQASAAAARAPLSLADLMGSTTARQSGSTTVTQGSTQASAAIEGAQLGSEGLGSPTSSSATVKPAPESTPAPRSNVPAKTKEAKKRKAQPMVSKQAAQASSGEAMTFICKARGMSVSHNAQTAVLTVTSSVTHGANLYCSHSGCRREGSKFRYCAYCKIPVARRNFRSRHNHGEKEGNVQEKVDEEDKKILFDPPKDAKPEGGATDTPSSPKPDDSQGQPYDGGRGGDVVGTNTIGIPSSITVTDSAAMASERLLDTATESSHGDMVMVDVPFPESVVAKTCEERRARWAKLLIQRPSDDGAKMDAWLKKVQAISDLDTPLSRQRSHSSSDASTQKETPSQANSQKDKDPS